MTGSKPDMVKPGVVGNRTKSPASSVTSILPVNGETAAPLDDGAEAGLAEFGIADAPAAGAADALREHGSWPQQRDDFGERIDHIWTIANKISDFQL